MKRAQTRTILLTLALALAAPTTMRAEPASPTAETYCDRERGVLAITVDNDSVGWQDGDYSSGFKIGYITPCESHLALDRLARSVLEQGYGPETRWRGVYALGHDIYTPTEIDTPTPGPGERPYAGFLYGSAGVIADRRAGAGAPVDTLDLVALDLGVVGPSAQADHVQRVFHEIIGAEEPQGWDAQIGDRVGVRLHVERTWRIPAWRAAALRIPAAALAAPLDADIVPHVGLAVGTIDASAAGGAIFRIGEALEDDYGPPRVRQGVSGPGVFDADDPFGWYLFAGGELRAVGRDLFVEGEDEAGAPGAEATPFVGDVQTGAALQFGASEVAFTYVFRSPQYDAQGDWARFGSLNLRTQF